jgi:hypothetical protein
MHCCDLDACLSIGIYTFLTGGSPRHGGILERCGPSAMRPLPGPTPMVCVEFSDSPAVPTIRNRCLSEFVRLIRVRNADSPAGSLQMTPGHVSSYRGRWLFPGVFLRRRGSWIACFSVRVGLRSASRNQAEGRQHSKTRNKTFRESCGETFVVARRPQRTETYFQKGNLGQDPI